MNVGHSEAKRLFDAGEFIELSRLAEFTPSLARSLDAKTRVILAHALALTGELKKARMLVELDDTAASILPIRARAHCVLGLICSAEGNVTLAIRHFESAIGLAREASDREQLAWA